VIGSGSFSVLDFGTGTGGGRVGTKVSGSPAGLLPVLLPGVTGKWPGGSVLFCRLRFSGWIGGSGKVVPGAALSGVDGK